MFDWLNNNLGSDTLGLSIWMRMGIVLAIILVAYLVDLIFTRVIVPVLQRLASHTSTQWDDLLLSDRVCRAFSHILPPIILCAALPFALRGMLATIVARLTLIYIIYNVCYFVTVLMSAIFSIFEYEKNTKANSLRGILQTFQLIAWIIAAILIISVLLDRSPIFLITGLGAAATVLMLVFQDSIKGLVAGIQLSTNDMLRVGDWIAMPSRNVDGTVTEITLSTIKVRNWDNTIMTIQPYALLTDTFQNWRGMTESEGRRLTRSVCVDMHSITLLDAATVDRYKRQGWLADSAQPGVATNLEAFRYCMTQYMRQMPEINAEMTLMVRQLPATAEGMPVQLYAFTRTREWIAYEDIQARLVEYMVALMPQFGILPYQRSSDNK